MASLSQAEGQDGVLGVTIERGNETEKSMQYELKSQRKFFVPDEEAQV
jgi:hypothetical protein